jgi:uncharacterized damage-inducible protein DinB
MSLRTYRKLAQNNRLANHRLHEACLRLGPGEFEAPRVSFFPTIKMTLNHILTVDWFYVDAVEGGQLGEKAWGERGAVRRHAGAGRSAARSRRAAAAGG